MERGGWCFPSEATPYDYPYLLATLAGREADRHLLADQSDDLQGRESGWKGDLEQADKAIAALGGDVSMDEAVAESRRLVLENWYRIQSLAQLMLRGLKANLKEGGDRYMMLGHEVRARFSAVI
jgi:hypothetical protein